MDYAALLQELSTAPLFDLWRLRAALYRMIEDPERIGKVRACLRIGMPISYFEESENRLVEAVVLDLNRTRLLVENVADKQRWNIQFASVNLEGVNVDIPASAGKFDRNAWKVGDQVAFKDKKNRDLYGTIVNLNPKTAGIVLKDGQKWRVAYCLLIPVLNGEVQTGNNPWEKVLTNSERTPRVIEACDPD